MSRTGRPPEKARKPQRWTPAVVAVSEALLCGTRGTVSETARVTGLSTGSCTNALRVLTELGLLEAEAGRGRGSARSVADRRALLDAYVTAATALRPTTSLQVGVAWRDPVAGLIEIGAGWDRAGLAWVATGGAAAGVVAPHSGVVTTAEVYVDTTTILGLEAAAGAVGLTPIDGGRLTLRPFPTVVIDQLAETTGGLRVAPWPRIYVDLEIACGSVNTTRLERALRNAEFEPDNQRVWRWRADGPERPAVVKFELLADLDDQPAGAEVNVTGLAGFLLAKTAAVRERRKPKDWYDLAFVLLHNDLGGPIEAADAVVAVGSFHDHPYKS